MFSDIFYLDTSKQHKIVFYNFQLLRKTIDKLKKSDLRKILKNCEKNIQLLTYDILALLNIFKHFIESEEGKSYVNQHKSDFDNKLYVYSNYLEQHHIWLKNAYAVFNLVNNYRQQNNLTF